MIERYLRLRKCILGFSLSPVVHGWDESDEEDHSGRFSVLQQRLKPLAKPDQSGWKYLNLTFPSRERLG
jgi:hypothetical protein